MRINSDVMTRVCMVANYIAMRRGRRIDMDIGESDDRNVVCVGVLSDACVDWKRDKYNG